MNNSLILIWGFFNQGTDRLIPTPNQVLLQKYMGRFPFHGSFQKNPSDVLGGWIGVTTDKMGVARLTEIEWFDENYLRFKKQYENLKEHVLYELQYDPSNKWYEGTYQVVEKGQKTLSGFARTFLIPTEITFFQR